MRFSILFFFVVGWLVTTAQTATSHNSGYYEQPFLLELKASENQVIFYSTDGSNPRFGKRYQGPISIGEASTLPNSIDEIPTTPLEGPWQLEMFRWKQPKSAPKDVWIVRYCIIENDEVIASESLTFFVGAPWKSKHTFPVISFVTDPSNLFDLDSGLFVPGHRFSQDSWDSTFFGNGNYTMKGKSWERSAHVELFDARLQPLQDFSSRFRLHGAVVGVLPQKSLRIYTDKTPDGTPLAWNQFAKEDSLESTRFILRNSGSDFVSTHFRDAFLSTVASDIGLEHQKSHPSVVYINGIYWGIYNIRERIDRYYIHEHFGLEEEEYDMIEGTGSDVMNGSADAYVELLTLLYENDAANDSIYHRIEEAIDVENYIDYILFETYFCNMDWPGNNVKFWRPKDGKWRWIFFDGDFMMSPYSFNKDGGFEHDALDHATTEVNNQWYNSKGSTYFLRNLMKNASFRNAFEMRYRELSETIFSEQYLLDRLNRFESLYAPEMDHQIDRWHYPESMSEWHSEVEKLRAFIQKRNVFYTEHLDAYLDTF